MVEKRAPAWLTSRLTLGLISAAVILIFWQLLGSVTNPLFFSTPVAIWNAFPVVAEKYGLLGRYFDTMGVFLIAMAVAVVAGIALGLITGLSPTLRYLTDFPVVMLYSTPGIVLIPLFVIWFGVHSLTEGALVFLAGVFPTLINTQIGVLEVGDEMTELGRSFGANRFEMVSQIIVPSVLPYILAGLRIAVPRGFVAVIGAEMLVTVHGLGGIALQFGNSFQTALYFVPVLLVVFTSYAMTELVKVAQHVFAPWRR